MNKTAFGTPMPVDVQPAGNKSVYVDRLRIDGYVPDGSQLRPYRTFADGVAAARMLYDADAVAGTNGLWGAPVIRVAPGDYSGEAAQTFEFVAYIIGEAPAVYLPAITTELNLILDNVILGDLTVELNCSLRNCSQQAATKVAQDGGGDLIASNTQLVELEVASGQAATYNSAIYTLTLLPDGDDGEDSVLITLFNSIVVTAFEFTPADAGTIQVTTFGSTVIPVVDVEEGITWTANVSAAPQLSVSDGAYTSNASYPAGA